MEHHRQFEVTVKLMRQELELLGLFLKRLFDVDEHKSKLAWHKLFARVLWPMIVLDPVSLLLYNDPEFFVCAVYLLVQMEREEHVRLVLHVSPYRGQLVVRSLSTVVVDAGAPEKLQVLTEGHEEFIGVQLSQVLLPQLSCPKLALPRPVPVPVPTQPLSVGQAH